MYTVIFFSILGAFIVVFIIAKDFGFEGADFGECAVGFGFLVIGAFFGFILGGLIAIALPATYKTDKWSENLESLQDNSSVDGSFFLGCGAVNGTMKYVYYCKETDSTFKMWQINYYDAQIKYKDGQPKVFITSKHIDKNDSWNKFAIDIQDLREWSCIFQVPKGTIKNNYELDAK